MNIRCTMTIQITEYSNTDKTYLSIKRLPGVLTATAGRIVILYFFVITRLHDTRDR